MSLCQDAAAMLSDSGVPVRAGDWCTRGILNETLVNDGDGSGLMRQVRRRLLTVMAGTIGTPARDSEIIIGEKPYRVREQAGDQGEVDGLHEFWIVVAP